MRRIREPIVEPTQQDIDHAFEMSIPEGLPGAIHWPDSTKFAFKAGWLCRGKWEADEEVKACEAELRRRGEDVK